MLTGSARTLGVYIRQQVVRTVVIRERTAGKKVLLVTNSVRYSAEVVRG